MSTQIGTLQPKARSGMAPVAILAVLVVAAIVVTFLPEERSRPVGTSSAAQTVSATTPTELRGGIVGGRSRATLANTPIELSGGIAHVAAPTARHPFGRAAVIPRVASTISANTPTELTGGMAFASVGSGVGLASPAVVARAKQLGAVIPATTGATSLVESIASRNAMLASYQEALNARIVASRNAMLASYQDAPDEVCAICWKYR